MLQNNIHEQLKDNLGRVCALVFFLLLTFAPANAQTTNPTDGSTPLGLSPGAPSGSYSLSGFESVNPYNGNLNFHLPLVGIGGRGGAGTSSVLAIDTKGWTVKHQETINSLGEQVDYYTPVASPWMPRPGYGPGVLVARRSGLNPNRRCGITTKIYQATLTRLTFTTGDGTEYELRDQLLGGAPVTVWDPCAPAASRGTVFTTADGSAATFISDAVIYDKLQGAGFSMLFPSGYLMLRDGTRYRIVDGNVTWMRDRNGNKLTFASSTNQAGQSVYTITDSLNRQVVITYADYGTTFSDQITIKGFGGATRTILVNHSTLNNALRSGYSIQTYHGLFPELNNASQYAQWNPWVVSSVTLPNNQQYQLKYNSYAELARVVVPTGGAIEYDYTAGSGALNDGDDYQIYRRVTERRVFADGGQNPESSMTYGEGCGPSCNGTMITIDQLNGGGTRLSQTRHYFYGNAADSLFTATGVSYPSRLEGREYKTESYAADGTTLLRRSETTWVNRAPVSWWWSPGDVSEPPNDPRVIDTTSTLTDVTPNLVTKKTFSYVPDSISVGLHNNVSDTYEYDYGSGSPPTYATRHLHTDYVMTNNNVSYADPANGTSYSVNDVHLRGLAREQKIYAVNTSTGAETLAADTSYEYDNYGTADTNHALIQTYPRAGYNELPISGLDSTFTTSYTTRGNATGTTQYFVVNGSVTGSISGYAQYDIAGNVVKAIDARGYATTFDFGDCFGTPNGDAHTNAGSQELVGQYAYALATSATNALGQTAYSQFDYYTGRPVDAEDANGITYSGYSDSEPLDRPTRVVRAVNQGTSVKSQSTFSYDDTNRIITTTSDFASYGDQALKSQAIYDGLGRTIETRTYEDSTHYIAVQQVPFVMLQDPDTGAWVPASQTSNPFRHTLGDPPNVGEQPVWTTTFVNSIDRTTKIRTPDNAIARSSYNGNAVTATDQSGKARKSVSDGLGRLTSVYEDPSGLNYQTSYAYDVLGDLLTITQGNQPQRTFVYDSLKRLTSAFNPENGTTNYTYDNNGNLLTRTDPRSITTTIAYDALNRPTSKSYNDSPQTPTVNFYYDSQTLPSGAPTFDRGYSTGRLVAVTYGGGSAGNYAGFDALGRSVRKIQQTDAINYLVEASYNDSAMTSETYASVPGYSDRRTVSYSFDSAGRVSSLNSNATTYAAAASVSGLSYASHGALISATYGNGLINAATYNNRLQVSEIRLGTSFNPTSKLDLTYDYGTTNNNGNVQSMGYSLVVGNHIQTLYTQSFSYDSLNRLASATETSGGNTSWSQTNGYDRYGNRWIDLGGGNQSLYFTTSTNRITGSSYDDAGNLLYDGAHAYTYDGENRIRTVDGATAYVYDGAGQRVRKLVGENTRFVYGIGGQLIMEFSGSNGSLKKEYVYGGGSMATIAPNGKGSLGVQYLTSDHLGTPRVITKADGSVAARHDYQPFGEELFAGKGGRTTGMGYGGSDGNRQKFTGYERDNETGLDFAQARYNSSTQGRFTSPDSLMGSIGNPQSLNRYAYVGNNPMNFTDPTGHMPSGGSAPTIHDGEGGGGSRWDDPTSPQAVLDAAGIVPSDRIVSTQQNFNAPEEPGFIPYYSIIYGGLEPPAGTNLSPQDPSSDEMETIQISTRASGDQDPQSYWQHRFATQLQADMVGTLIAWDNNNQYILWIQFAENFERTVAGLSNKGYLTGPANFAFNPYHHGGGQEFRDPDSKWGRLSFHFTVPYPQKQIILLPPPLGGAVIPDRSPARGIQVHVDFHNPKTQLFPHAKDFLRDVVRQILN